MTSPYGDQFRAIGERALEALSRLHEAREQAIKLAREVVQLSANTIRAVHRRDLDQARQLLDRAGELVRRADRDFRPFPEVFYAGYLQDARKEFCEASVFSAVISGRPIPTPEELGVDMAPYLNGLGEVTGELRRFILDSLRQDDVSRCEELLEVMDEIYSLLITIDFPEAVTGGLRRTTDMVRGVLERTRGDLTMALVQRRLTQRLASAQEGRVPDP